MPNSTGTIIYKPLESNSTGTIIYKPPESTTPSFPKKTTLSF